MDVDEVALSDVPALPGGTLTLRYAEGYDFVQILHDEGDRNLVNGDQGNLPVSSE